ncbi:hypothetical protein ACJIZ3_010057 [Penstemon smallii]|uniref:Uncharacterized protein n=1 Tax=Penstemon smallii TaxID=265156 RepID=A0ABD3TFC5_9LAMI
MGWIQYLCLTQLSKPGREKIAESHKHRFFTMTFYNVKYQSNLHIRNHTLGLLIM